jgi:hypothetical protein
MRQYYEHNRRVLADFGHGDGDRQTGRQRVGQTKHQADRHNLETGRAPVAAADDQADRQGNQEADQSGHHHEAEADGHAEADCLLCELHRGSGGRCGADPPRGARVLKEAGSRRRRHRVRAIRPGR